MPERPANPSPDYLPSTGAGTAPPPSETLSEDERERPRQDRRPRARPGRGDHHRRARAAPDRWGLSVGAWLAIGWMVFVVVIAVLAKTGIVTWGDPQNSIASCARKGPVRERGDRAGPPARL